MRDPERIDAVIEALRTYWRAHPDERLGQIVMNAFRLEWAERRKSPEYRKWLDSDEDGVAFSAMFNIEDDRLARGIELLAET